MKAIMLSIKPKYVSMILNKTKTIEVRKRFPVDYVGWVYIYCTKDSKSDETLCYDGFSGILSFRPNYRVGTADKVFNGKVVARFWCDKVEEIEKPKYNLCYTTKSLTEMNLLKHSCLSFMELHDYLDYKNGKGIHITNLEIFDQPKEISEFKNICPNVLCDKCKYGSKEIDLALPICKRQLTRAPSNYCYIEI